MYGKIRQAADALLICLQKPLHGLRLVLLPRINHRHVVWRDVLLPLETLKLLQNFFALFRTPGSFVGIRQFGLARFRSL